MNLTDLNFADAADKGAALTLLHPTKRTPLVFGKSELVQIDLRGQDSDAFIEADNASRERAVEASRNGQKFSAAEADLRGAEILARATTGWRGIPQGWIDGTKDETPAKFSFENAVKLYTNRGVKWVRAQVDAFVGERANFLTA